MLKVCNYVVLKFEVWENIFDVEEIEIQFVVILNSSQGFFSNRGEKISMVSFRGNRNRVYKQQNVNVGGGPNLLLGRTSFSDMLKVVMSEPPFS